ncbi:MAG: LapA family protein [Mariprofundaceae bacterium]
MNWINVLLVLALTTLATMFALSNSDLVQLRFGASPAYEIPLFVPIFSAFGLGFVGGMLSLSFSRRKHKREIRQLEQENQNLKQELNNLRTLPLQDDT